MERIGIAASKMSKGNLLTYNLFVILISSLCALIFFFICGFSILLVVSLIFLLLHAVKPGNLHAGLMPMFRICLTILGVVVGIFNIIAILKNIKWTKSKI